MKKLFIIILFFISYNSYSNSLVLSYGKSNHNTIQHSIEAGYMTDEILMKLGCQFGITGGYEYNNFSIYLGKNLDISDKTTITISGIVGAAISDRIDDIDQTFNFNGRDHAAFNYGAEVLINIKIVPKFGLNGGIEFTNYGRFVPKVGISLQL